MFRPDGLNRHRTFCAKATEYRFFLGTNGTFCRIDHMLGRKASLTKLKTEIGIFSDYNDIKQNYRQKPEIFTNM